MNEREINIKAWLEKAHTDWQTAQALVEQIKPPILDTACFHCQQTAEKAIKGYLTFKQSNFQKSHNLVYLLELYANHESEFSNLLNEAEVLTPYAVEICYPGDALSPSLEDGRIALESAKRIWNFVLAHIPNDYHPLDESHS
jgi:HEPN domain-containing protein